MSIRQFFPYVILGCGFASLCAGQSADPKPATRAAEIEKARDAKEAALRPEEVTRTERILREIKEKHWRSG